MPHENIIDCGGLICSTKLCGTDKCPRAKHADIKTRPTINTGYKDHPEVVFLEKTIVENGTHEVYMHDE